jgi:hypothetical protein
MHQGEALCIQQQAPAAFFTPQAVCSMLRVSRWCRPCSGRLAAFGWVWRAHAAQQRLA